MMGNALTAMLNTADNSRAPWRCSGLREHSADATLGDGWRIVEGRLRYSGTDRLVIGVVADAGGSDPKTIATLGRIRQALEAEGVNLVLTLGGMGSTRAELTATLGALASPRPTVALPGDLESMPALHAAIADLRARGRSIVDGRGIEAIESPSALLGIIPGVGSEYRSTAGKDGCTWTASDVSDSFREWSRFPGLRIAVSAEAPRETIDGEITGEVALMPDQAIDILLHGPAQAGPSPAAQGGRDGARVSLSPGTADATPRLPPIRGSAAGLLAIDGHKWSWRPIR